MDESILNTIKHMLGLEPDYTAFDTDILVLINSAFSVLYQLKVGTKEPFRIEDDSAVWSDFVSDDQKLEMVKEYIYISCRIVFDPPSSSYVLTAYKERKDEIEWRAKISSEFYPIEEPTTIASSEEDKQDGN